MFFVSLCLHYYAAHAFGLALHDGAHVGREHDEAERSRGQPVEEGLEGRADEEVLDDDGEACRGVLVRGVRGDGVAPSHGYTPGAVSPVSSENPSIRFMAWIAWPAAPLTRLSNAAMVITQSDRVSANTARSQKLDPRL